MTSEEQRLLTQFLDELGRAQGVAKDPAAEAMISTAAKTQPDAVYLLVQRCLLQDQALNAAQSRIAELQQRLAREKAPPAPAGGGFLGANPWGRPAAAAASAMPAAPTGAYPPVSPAAASPFSGFLGNVAATAAGIAGGAFLYHGIESLLHSSHAGDNVDRVAHSGEHSDSDFASHDASVPEDDFTDASYGGGDDDFETYDDDINSVDV